MIVKQFEDLTIWQQARALTKEIYAIVRQPAFSKDYRFVGQITAAAGSVMDNIAEGFERDSKKEFLVFLSIAKGSCGEVRSQLHRAYDVGYIDTENYERLVAATLQNSRMLSNFIRSLKNSEFEGLKYKQVENANMNPET